MAMNAFTCTSKMMLRQTALVRLRITPSTLWMTSGQSLPGYTLQESDITGYQLNLAIELNWHLVL